jgi:hypothetical protein
MLLKAGVVGADAQAARKNVLDGLVSEGRLGMVKAFAACTGRSNQ